MIETAETPLRVPSYYISNIARDRDTVVSCIGTPRIDNESGLGSRFANCINYVFVFKDIMTSTKASSGDPGERYPPRAGYGPCISYDSVVLDVVLRKLIE